MPGEGSGEQGNMEKTGCKIICGAPTTLAVKGLMMMIMRIYKQKKKKFRVGGKKQGRSGNRKPTFFLCVVSALRLLCIERIFG